MEGTWVGYFIGSTGEVSYTIEIIEQDLSILVLKGASYSSDGDLRARWETISAALDTIKGTLTYSHICDVIGVAVPQQGIGIFDLRRSSARAPADEIEGYSASLTHGRRAQSYERKISDKGLKKAEALPEALKFAAARLTIGKELINMVDEPQQPIAADQPIAPVAPAEQPPPDNRPAAPAAPQPAAPPAAPAAPAGQPAPMVAALPPAPALPDGQLRPVDYDRIKQRLEEGVAEHSPSVDAWCFNGGTLLTLSFTAAAALFSSQTFGEKLTYVGAILASLAGVLVAAERALAFGARWRFHHELRNGYRAIIDMIDFAALLPEGPEKQKYNKDIWTALYSLRSRESAIPGTGTAPQ